MHEIRKILVGVDGSANSIRAAEMAADLAKRYSAETRLIFVIGGSDYTMLEGKEVWMEKASHIGENELKKAEDIMIAAGVKYTKDIDFGHPVKKLLENAKESDMVVLGAHGKGAVKGIFMGSISLRVSQECPVPIVIVP
ncbi:MAG: Universal stress protein family protein [Methanomassiliicoccales archaeon PtaU1.Bin124]|nr:MAG: Universal stress protein family protein [Methanomassiliicoccales archaeon PtaU1.Bin124]